MAIPFGDYDKSDKPEEKGSNMQKENNENKNICSETPKSLQFSQLNAHSSQGPNVYCISNSSFFNCGPTFIQESNRLNKIQKNSTSCKGKVEPGCKIKVRKGVFTSPRAITSEDIRIVAEDIGENWTKLLKSLPGVTSDNLIFHQAFVDAMDKNDKRSLAEITLSTWKCVLPEFSTIGNLCKTMFTIGHPNIVAHLKP